MNTALDAIVGIMTQHFGRKPTVDEVYGFIMGTEEERDAIWEQRRVREQ